MVFSTYIHTYIHTCKLPFFFYKFIQFLTHIRTVRFTKRKGIGGLQITFRNNLVLYIPTLLDILITQETIFDDCYGVTQLRKPKVICDIGAAGGEWSVYVGLLFPEATILAIEPDPYSLDRMQYHMNINNTRNVIPMQYAVGADGPQTLSIARDHTQSSLFQKSSKTVCVSGILLDTLLDQYSSVDFLKVDCEGCEEVLFARVELKTLQKIQHIAIEYHEFISSGVSARILQKLQSCGFAARKHPDPYTSDLGFIFASRLS